MRYEQHKRIGVFLFVVLISMIGILLGCRQSIGEQKNRDDRARRSSSFVMRSISHDSEKCCEPFPEMPFSEEVAEEEENLLNSFRTGSK